MRLAMFNVSGIAGNNTDIRSSIRCSPRMAGGVYATVYDPTGSTMYFSHCHLRPAVNGDFQQRRDVDSQGTCNFVWGYTALPASDNFRRIPTAQKNNLLLTASLPKSRGAEDW